MLHLNTSEFQKKYIFKHFYLHKKCSDGKYNKDTTI